jgi:hypothetical protein
MYCSMYVEWIQTWVDVLSEIAGSAVREKESSLNKSHSKG